MLRRLWFALQGLAVPPRCAIAVTAAGARCLRGRAPAAWLADCGDACRDFGIRDGRFDVVLRAGRLQLRFGPGMPAACHQRLRNLLDLHRRSFA